MHWLNFNWHHQNLQQMAFSFNPLGTNGFLFLVRNNKLRIYLGVSGYNFQKTLYSCADPGIFARGGPGQSDKKSSDSSAHFTDGKWSISKKSITFQGSRGGSNIFQRGSNFFQGGSNCLFPIETHITCDFSGGVWTPCPPPLDPHLILIFLPLQQCIGPDEMQHYAAFHLGLHCLQKYPLRGFHEHKGLKNQIRFYIFHVIHLLTEDSCKISSLVFEFTLQGSGDKDSTCPLVINSEI